MTIPTVRPAPLCLDHAVLTATGRDIVSAVVSYRAAVSRVCRARRDGRPASRHLACARSADDTIRGLLPFTVPGRSRLLDALTAESQWWDDGRFGPFYRQQLREALAEVLTAYRTRCCVAHGQPCRETRDGEPCCERCPEW
jgi:hypothetical protein